MRYGRKAKRARKVIMMSTTKRVEKAELKFIARLSASKDDRKTFVKSRRYNVQIFVTYVKNVVWFQLASVTPLELNGEHHLPLSFSLDE